ncbi:MAG: hypothetical protein CSA09_03340 [Candidatus Contendobacter odensis]|uniref:Transposase n=1 Tax=Candidatus Contendibacter odensensis TaxID=1400860 RepID=A0A2G6PEW0_9GAMM|nr:MAG: hypothetical protein CSA09_03340 [Candidatus Contendobacter odensis]
MMSSSWVLDTAVFHESAKTHQLIKDRGAFSDFNPIEGGFATLKKHREYQSPQTLDDLIKYYRQLGIDYRQSMD